MSESINADFTNISEFADLNIQHHSTTEMDVLGCNGPRGLDREVQLLVAVGQLGPSLGALGVVEGLIQTWLLRGWIYVAEFSA